MQAKLIRDSDGTNPKWSKKAYHEALEKGVEYNVPRLVPRPAGTIINHPDAYQLVQLGMAVPHDDECRRRCGMNEEQIAAAITAQDRFEEGIVSDVEDDSDDDSEPEGETLVAEDPPE